MLPEHITVRRCSYRTDVFYAQMANNCPNTTSAEIYSPPYLFKGSRPNITSAPGGIGYGQSFFVGTPDATALQMWH